MRGVGGDCIGHGECDGAIAVACPRARGEDALLPITPKGPTLLIEQSSDAQTSVPPCDHKVDADPLDSDVDLLMAEVLGGHPGHEQPQATRCDGGDRALVDSISLRGPTLAEGGERRTSRAATGAEGRHNLTAAGWRQLRPGPVAAVVAEQPWGEVEDMGEDRGQHVPPHGVSTRARRGGRGSTTPRLTDVPSKSFDKRPSCVRPSWVLEPQHALTGASVGAPEAVEVSVGVTTPVVSSPKHPVTCPVPPHSQRRSPARPGAVALRPGGDGWSAAAATPRSEASVEGSPVRRGRRYSMSERAATAVKLQSPAPPRGDGGSVVSTRRRRCSSVGSSSPSARSPRRDDGEQARDKQTSRCSYVSDTSTVRRDSTSGSTSHVEWAGHVGTGRARATPPRHPAPTPRRPPPKSPDEVQTPPGGMDRDTQRGGTPQARGLTLTSSSPRARARRLHAVR